MRDEDKHQPMTALTLHFVAGDPNAILSAIDNSNFDYDETIEEVKRHANEALERIRLAHAAMHRRT